MSPGLEGLSQAALRAERSVAQVVEIRELTRASRRIIAESLDLLRATQPQRATAAPLWRQRRR